MSTSLLYHAFGVRGYRYVKTEYVNGEVVFGGRRGPIENRKLRELRQHKCLAIRQKAAEVLGVLTPRRKPRTTSYRRLGRGSLAVAQGACRDQARPQSHPSKVSAARMPIAPSGS